MNIFQTIGGKRPQKSMFDLSHSRKFSMTPGILTPILCEETIPSDQWRYNNSALIRFMALQAPMMHLVDVYSYGFKVPYRLTMAQSQFETFITGGPKGDGKNAAGELVEMPYVRTSDEPLYSEANGFNLNTYFGTGTLPDYLGVAIGDPTGNDLPGPRLALAPILAFWRIYCEFFRDQNLQVNWVEDFPQLFNSQGGDLTVALIDAYDGNGFSGEQFNVFELPQVCWEKDYFTSALPFAQRGAPVETPLSGDATVNYKTFSNVSGAAAGTATQALGVRDATTFVNRSSDGTFDDPAQDTRIENIDSVEMQSGGFTINALRIAARLQEWLEKMARGGARYIEQMKSMFDVTSSDARLQRPEFLGGGRIDVHISEVLQTDGTESAGNTTPQGNMAGHGVAAGNVSGWNTYCEEHCLIIQLIFLRPKTAYQQGTKRLFTHRFDKLDWPWPTFAHLGEQEIAQSEIFMSGKEIENVQTFGYQSRYAECKYIPSTVHGQFKTSLDFWHWGREFATSPTLSKEFVLCDPDPRVFNVLQNTDALYCIVKNNISCVRPLPYHGDPYL